jgi:hypothetical protein
MTLAFAVTDYLLLLTSNLFSSSILPTPVVVSARAVPIIDSFLWNTGCHGSMRYLIGSARRGRVITAWKIRGLRPDMKKILAYYYHFI